MILSQQVASAINNDLPLKRKRFRLSKRQKQELLNPLSETNEDAEFMPSSPTNSTSIPYLNLQDDYTSNSSPVLFSQDSHYCFVPSGSTVRIYSLLTAQLLSTLSVPSSSSSIPGKVTCTLLNPANVLQLVVGSSDGMLRVWDYTEGTLLRTLDLGSPIQFACGNSTIPDQIFVALIDNSSNELSPSAGIYSISLRPSTLSSIGSASFASSSTPRSTSRRMRLAQPRVLRSLQLSPSGQYLISLNPNTINICRTKNLAAGFSTHLESDNPFTTMAFHPTENYFATGSRNGMIKIWYGVLDEVDSTAKGERKTSSIVTTEVEVSTSTLHWHANPIASLTFTPNGAYLISGGEEAVLVLWQLNSNHREYVPRLGAPILSLSVTNSSTAEQEVVAKLRNGTVIFIGSQNLTISKMISGLQVGSSHSKDIPLLRSTRQPLAIHPVTKSLVLNGGHPSSIQFYSVLDQIPILEVEISPSNRVLAHCSTIEPTRVEIVCFSPPSTRGKASSSFWMATLDKWSNGTFSAERQLKFWAYQNEQFGFVLTTRVDRPHDGDIISMEFSPSAELPLLLTTSTDGSIKVWSCVDKSWRCQSKTSYRSFVPTAATWSQDASTYAVAFSDTVVLSATATGEFIHAFPCANISPLHFVRFTGQEGTHLLVAGGGGTTTWDVLSLEERSSTSFHMQSMQVRPGSDLIVGTDPMLGDLKRSSSQGQVLVTDLSSNENQSQAHLLPHQVRQSIWVPQEYMLDPKEISLATLNEHGELALIGESLIRAVRNPTPSTQLPSASTEQSRLFEEIFGNTPPNITVRKPLVITEDNGVSLKVTPEWATTILDVPSHLLPPPRLLWPPIMGSYKSASFKRNQEVGIVKDTPTILNSANSARNFTKALKNQYFPSPDSLLEIFKGNMVL